MLEVVVIRTVVVYECVFAHECVENIYNAEKNVFAVVHMMSSYHIIQAIWVGVFPMLAATVVVGILCYLLCCLNQIKIRLMQSRKRKRMREARKRALKEKQPLSQPIKVETRIVQGI